MIRFVRDWLLAVIIAPIFIYAFAASLRQGYAIAWNAIETIIGLFT